MRIAFYGNVCNNHYQIAKALRKYSDFDVHVYIDDNADPQQLPESDDPELLNDYPSWIHKKRLVRLSDKLFPWRAPLVDELSEYDLVVVSGIGPMFAQFCDTPVAFLSAGADLTMASFPIEFISRYPTLGRKLKALWIGPWQKRGIQRCREVWTQPFAPFRTAVKKLGLPNERVPTTYFPVAIDTARIKEDAAPHASEMDAVREITSRFDFTVFHPSRLMMHDSRATRASGQWKGNDILFRAFARFVADSGALRAGLVVIDRPASPDIGSARDLVEELGIGRNVLWLKPPRAFGFSRAELMTLYSIADVVADDFGVGWFGSVVLEGLAAGRPVLCYVDEAAMGQLYPSHPLFSSHEVAENAQFLMDLYRSPALRRTRGEAGRLWVAAYHSPVATAQTYVKRMREIAARLAVQRTDLQHVTNR